MPKMKEGKWILQDSILTFEIYQKSELKTIRLYLEAVNDEHLSFNIDQMNIVLDKIKDLLCFENLTDTEK
tara:strand:- start:900 stop:1109 length:210 start_codon:yes stop_codon:yes gene_type:complete